MHHKRSLAVAQATLNVKVSGSAKIKSNDLNTLKSCAGVKIGRRLRTKSVHCPTTRLHYGSQYPANNSNLTVIFVAQRNLLAAVQRSRQTSQVRQGAAVVLTELRQVSCANAPVFSTLFRHDNGSASANQVAQNQFAKFLCAAVVLHLAPSSATVLPFQMPLRCPSLCAPE